MNRKEAMLYVFFIFYTFFISVGVLFDYLLIGAISTLTINILFLTVYPVTRKKYIFITMLGLYTLLFNCSLFVSYDLLYINSISYSIFPYIILPILCFIILTPLVYVKRPNLELIIKNRNTLIFIYLLCPFILMSFVYLVPYTLNTFLYGAKDIRTSLNDTSILPETIMTTVSVGISMFYPLFIFLLFYAFIVKANKLAVLIIFLGVVNGFIGGLIFAARDRFLWIPFFIIINFWLWYPYLSVNLLKKIKRLLIFILIFSLFFITLFTVDRFSSSDTGVGGSLLVYFGAQPYIFSEAVAQHPDSLYYGLDLRFPLFLSMLGLDPIEVVRNVPYQWMFGTLFSDFYMMGGWLYCMFLIVLLNIIYTYIYLYKNESPWLYVLLFMLHIQILIQGVFYFSLGFSGGNFYIILNFLLILFLNIFNRIKLKL